VKPKPGWLHETKVPALLDRLLMKAISFAEPGWTAGDCIAVNVGAVPEYASQLAYSSKELIFAKICFLGAVGSLGA